MIKYFLKAKHWHLFGIFIILFIISKMYYSYIFNFNEFGLVDYKPNAFSNYKNLLIIVRVFSTFVFMLWIWSICVGLNNLLPNLNRLYLNQFKTIFYFYNIYFIYDLITSNIIFSSLLSSKINFLEEIQRFTSFSNIFLDLLSLFSLIYFVYFSAKTIQTIELNKELKFKEFSRVFFLILFLPVGIWFIQPRINKIYSKTLIKNNFE